MGSSPDCNCMCSGFSPPPATSGACCYYDLASGWLCLDYVSESYCHSLFFGSFNISEVCSGVTCDTQCFTAGSEVLMSDGAIKFIEDIEHGDRVASIHGGYNSVERVVRTTLGDRKLVSINCSKPFVTEDHPIMTKDGFKSFNYCQSSAKYPHIELQGEMVVGDKILTTGEYEQLKKFELIEGDHTLPLHNLQLDGDHTYFVEGYGVHNKSIPPDPTGAICSDLSGIFSSYSFEWGLNGSSASSGLALFNTSGVATHWEGQIGSAEDINSATLFQSVPGTYNVFIESTVVNYNSDSTADNCIGGDGSGVVVREDTLFNVSYLATETILKGII